MFGDGIGAGSYRCSPSHVTIANEINTRLGVVRTGYIKTVTLHLKDPVK